MSSTFALIAGLFSLLVAGVVGRYGWRQRRHRALVTETPTTAVRDLDEEGLVELEGEVAAAETFESPIGGDEAVLSAWEVEEWDERGESEMWETRATGVYATPFALDDGTGEVRVEVGDHVEGEDDGGFDVQVGALDVDRLLSTGVSVDDVFCSFERFPVATSVPPDAEPPERVAEFVRGEAGVSTQTDSITNVLDLGNAHGERRYYEATVEPGQEIYLLGEAQAVPDATYPLGPDDVVVRPPAGDGSLIVSDRSEEALVSELGQYRWAVGAAAVLGAVGVGLLLVGGGVLAV